MDGYLGETIVDVKDTPYANYTKSDWALYFITCYGSIDGAHHKDWVLDQCARVLNGTEVIIKQAEWDNGLKEYRITTGKKSKKYKKFVKECLGEYDEEMEEYEYRYEKGIAP
jgi:hypothetical protein